MEHPMMIRATFFAALLLGAALGVASLPGPDWIAAAGATAASKTVCSLSMQGDGNQPGLKSVQFSCTGGTVTAAAHAILLNFWGPNLPKQGVDWTQDKKCRPHSGCLLTICGGSDAMFVNTRITAVAVTPGTGSQRGGVALCISQGSRVTLRNCSFDASSLTPLVPYGSTTCVLLDQCSISNNIITRRGVGVPSTRGVGARNATDVLQIKNFARNVAQGLSTIAAGGAQIGISRSTFKGNTGSLGGALYVSNASRVTIQGSRFEGNTAAFGGAILATGQARVDILPGMPGTIFLDNAAALGGGDICVWEKAAVHISAALLVGGKAKNGGSIQLDDKSTCSISHTSIQQGRAVDMGEGGCLKLPGNSSMRISNSNVSGCRAQFTGGGIQIDETAWLVLINSTVSSNIAGYEGRDKFSSYGGGISASGQSRVELQGATISNNNASWEGGGLCVWRGASLLVSGPVKTRVVNNTSYKVGGGLRLRTFNFSPTQVADMLLAKDNSAPYGDMSPYNIDVAGTRITVVDDGGADHVIASDSKDMRLVVTLNVSGAHGLPSADRISYSHGDQPCLFPVQTTTEGKLRKLRLGFKYPPGDYYLRIFFPDMPGAVFINVTVIPCPAGFVTAGRDDTCNPCPQGMYSFNVADVTCSLCPPDAVCPGRDVVWPAAGFWKSAPQSVQIHRCLNSAACVGATTLNATASNRTAARGLLAITAGTDYKTAQCAEPYQGHVCGECKPGWGKVRPFFCRKCMPAAAIVLYVVAAVVMIGLVKLLVHVTTSANLAPHKAAAQGPLPAVLVRALVIHTQWLYILSTMVGVPWPATLTVPLQVVGGLWSSISGSSVGLDCILQGRQGLPVAVQKLLLSLFLPAGILCVVLAVEAGMHFLRPQTLRRSPSAGHDFVSVVMCIVLMFFPTWVNTALSLFACVSLDTPAAPPFQADEVGSWWVEDLSQQCYEGYHKGWALGLGIPLTLLCCVGLPGGVFAFMWRSRKQGRLQDARFEKHYGFVFRHWRDEWCWWEAVMLLQTCALVVVSTFGFVLGRFYQSILSATVLACVGMLLLVVKPFRCPTAGKVSVSSVCVLFLTTQVALTFIPYNTPGPPAAYGSVMGVVLLLANLAFLLGTTWKLLSVVDWALLQRAKLLRLSAAFIQRCCYSGHTASSVPTRSVRPQDQN